MLKSKYYRNILARYFKEVAWINDKEMVEATFNFNNITVEFISDSKCIKRGYYDGQKIMWSQEWTYDKLDGKLIWYYYDGRISSIRYFINGIEQ